jgi:hypothetical protein
MNRCRIVPAIDLIDGRCVRLRKGNFDEKEVVGEDPVEVGVAAVRRRLAEDGEDGLEGAQRVRFVLQGLARGRQPPRERARGDRWGCLRDSSPFV